ncbi:cobalamin-dependent protein [Lutibacter sp.]
MIINSPLFREVNPLYDEDSLPPIGLGYIASTLEIKGFSVKLVDSIADSISLKGLQNIIKKYNPSVIATNIFTTNYNLVKELIENLEDQTRKIVIGGLSTRTLYEKIFLWTYKGEIDVIFGDGELILPDILKRKEVQSPNDKIKNRRYFKIDTLSPYFCKDISTLPLNRSFFLMSLSNIL